MSNRYFVFAAFDGPLAGSRATMNAYGRDGMSAFLKQVTVWRKNKNVGDSKILHFCIDEADGRWTYMRNKENGFDRIGPIAVRNATLAEMFEVAMSPPEVNAISAEDATWAG